MGRLSLILVGTSLLASTAGGALYAASIRVHDTRTAAAAAFLSVIEGEIVSELQQLVHPAYELAGLAATLPGAQFPPDAGWRAPIPPGNDHPAKDWIVAATRSVPQIISVRLAFENSALFQAFDLRTASDNWREEADVPMEAAMATRRIQGNILGRYDDWLFSDAAGATLGALRVSEPRFDPLQPWYFAASVVAESMAPAVLAQTGLAGVTVVVQTNDFPIAALSVDLSLGPLTQFLIEMAEMAGNGVEIALLDSSGALLAASNERALALRSPEEGLPELIVLRSQALNALMKVDETGGFVTRGYVLEVGGQDWVTTRTELPVQFGSDPVVLMAVVPVKAFTGW